MTVYHKLINGNMLNNYELGDITPEEALKQGYKPLIETPREKNKEYSLMLVENSKNIVAIYNEIKPLEEEFSDESNEKHNEENLEENEEE